MLNFPGGSAVHIETRIPPPDAGVVGAVFLATF